jgi:hypothetical protein
MGEHLHNTNKSGAAQQSNDGGVVGEGLYYKMWMKQLEDDAQEQQQEQEK